MAARIGSPQIRRAYRFLIEAEQAERLFTQEELARASGWKATTTEAYVTKKLRPYLEQERGHFKCSGLSQFTEENFCRLCSQTSLLASDPRKPLLPPQVEGLVLKARDAAFAAVQHYNNPTTAFRSGNYIVLMIIGHTALFHAIFERRGISYVALDRHGQPRLTSDGEPMLWDALHCARVYDQSPKSPLLANLDLFIPIRHKIEHRFMPQLDPWIAGHCQSLLMNFERILTTEFTPYYSLNTSLTIALQFSTQRTAEAADALRRMHSAEYEALKEHIHRYEATLPDEIVADPNYAFRVWLVPKTARSARKSDISIEVADVQQLPADEREELETKFVAIRTVPTEVDLWDRFTLTHGDLALGIGLSTSKTTALIRALKLQDDPSCFRTRTRGKTRIYGYSAQALGRLRAALDEGLDPQEVWKRYWADVRESQRLRRS